MSKKNVAAKHTTALVAYLFVVWGFYRFLFKLPEEVEEIIIKPLLWLVPVFFLVKKEKLKLSSIGITSKNTFKAIYLSLALGVLFSVEGLVINFFKHKGADFSANIGEQPFFLSLLMSFITAISEEVTFRGYIFSRIWKITGNELKANLLTSILWAMIHVPIAVFWWNLGFSSTLIYLLLTTMFGIGSAYVFARTKNVLSSILLHVLWEWPIILFR
jgi:membrane protease YdiL (CAAX protease family)